jgi:hypothetical protein
MQSYTITHPLFKQLSSCVPLSTSCFYHSTISQFLSWWKYTYFFFNYTPWRKSFREVIKFHEIVKFHEISWNFMKLHEKFHKYFMKVHEIFMKFHEISRNFINSFHEILWNILWNFMKFHQLEFHKISWPWNFMTFGFDRAVSTNGCIIVSFLNDSDLIAGCLDKPCSS